MKINALYDKEPTKGKEVGEFWQNRFDRALLFRQSHPNGDKAWKKWLQLYKGEHWSVMDSKGDDLSSDNPRDKVTVNVTGSSVLNMLPFLIRKRPKFMVKPKRPQFDISGKIQDSLLNYCWKEYDMQIQARRCALDGIIMGHGILKTGFTLEVDESYKIPASGRIEYRDYVKKQAPWVKRISPFHFVFDPEASEHNLESARWCGEMMYLPLPDILENERYNPKAIKAIKDATYEPTTVSSMATLFNGAEEGVKWIEEDEDKYGDLRRVVCFEIWDKRTGKYFFFAHGVHIPLIEKETWPYDYLEGFPYERYEFIPIPEEPFPRGLPAAIEDQQYELNRIRTSMFQHRRRFNRKYISVKEEVDETELTKLTTGEDGTVILADSTDSIAPIQEANLSTDEYNIEGTVKDDIRELIGSDELARGGALPSRTTATEVQARTKLYGLKLEDKVEQFDRFIEESGRKILQHIKANWVTSDVVKIVGPAGNFWKEWTPEDIQAEVDVEVEATSTEMVDEVTERQQAIQIMQILTGNMQLLMQAGVPVNWTELFKWVIGKWESLEDVQRFFPASGVLNAPIAMQAPGEMPPGAPLGAAGGFNTGAPPAQTAAPGAPPNPQAQAAQPSGGTGQVLSGLMGALGGGG